MAAAAALALSSSCAGIAGNLSASVNDGRIGCENVRSVVVRGCKKWNSLLSSSVSLSGCPIVVASGVQAVRVSYSAGRVRASASRSQEAVREFVLKEFNAGRALKVPELLTLSQGKFCFLLYCFAVIFLRHHPLLVHEEYLLSRAYLNSILVHGNETSSSSLSSSSCVQTRGMCLENVLNRWLQGYRTLMRRMWQQWWLLRIRYEFLNCELPSKLMWKTYLSFGLIASLQVVVWGLNFKPPLRCM